MTAFILPEASILLDPISASDLLGLQLGQRIVSTYNNSDSMIGAGGLSGEMNKIQYKLEDGTLLTVVIKTTKETSVVNSQSLGLAREGLFYASLAPLINSAFPNILPKVYFSSGNMASGKKLIVMEDLADLKAIQAGYFFGSGSPHNWGKDLDSLTENVFFDGSAAVEVSRIAFKIAAKFHGIFWMDNKLIIPENSWLRGKIQSKNVFQVIFNKMYLK